MDFEVAGVAEADKVPEYIEDADCPIGAVKRYDVVGSEVCHLIAYV